MKNIIKLLSLMFILGLVSASQPADAGNGFTIDGRWAGMAFASSFDLDGDGIAARTFDMKTYGTPVFAALQGAVDASLVATPGAGSCTDPLAFELLPVGRFLFRSPLGDALYVDTDSSQHLCFNPANPTEVQHFTVTGGTGVFAGRTGRGTATIRDVLIAAAPNGAPQVIDSRGEFTITIQ